MKKSKFLLMVISTLSFSISLPAFSAPKKKKVKSEDTEEASSSAVSSGQPPYGTAGCGLGSMVFDKPKAGFSQVFAATLNGTGMQTFGITSGTSNCVDTKALAALERQEFLAANLADLRKNAAQGSGETLEAFAHLLGCANLTQFADTVRSQQIKLFEVMDPKAVDMKFARLLESSELNTHCVGTAS